MCIKFLTSRLEKKITEISLKEFSLKTFSLSCDSFFLLFLILLSLVYGYIVKMRSLFFEKNILKASKLPCMVISIGNITAGGSGKTPMAIYIAEAMKKTGFRPVVLSRGYRGRMENNMGIAGDGNMAISTPEDAGDEPHMMAKRCSFPVVVGKNRFKAGMMAIKKFHPDLIILDDGFQHLQLKRDINIVLLDCKKPFGNGRLLPAGRLREMPDEIGKRADVVIFTRCSLKDHDGNRYKGNTNNGTMALDKYRMPEFNKSIGDISKPCFYTSHKPFLYLFKKYENTRLSKKTMSNPDQYNLDKLKGKNAVLFSGIADNRAFRDTVENLNIHVKDHLEFMDHCRYNKHDIDFIIKRGKESGAEIIITTEKDNARLSDDIDWKIDFAVIGIDIDWSVNGHEYDGEFLSFIKEIVTSNHLN